MTADIAKLGPMLRTWRGRLSPAAAGLSAGRGRRVSGLRREDLAELAGISVDYVVRLEQGRYETPSAQVAAALARALQLTDAERDHLYRLAGLAAPARGQLRVRQGPRLAQRCRTSRRAPCSGTDECPGRDARLQHAPPADPPALVVALPFVHVNSSPELAVPWCDESPRAQEKSGERTPTLR
jgi:transcriptional regulator with XRE-family HTH domain